MLAGQVSDGGALTRDENGSGNEHVRPEIPKTDFTVDSAPFSPAGMASIGWACCPASTDWAR